MPEPLYIAVVGSGAAEEAQLVAAEDAGRLLAERGAIVVTGGRGGVMEAASRGAQAAGGVTVGILPDADRSQANPHLSVAVPTGMGEARNALVVRAADGLVAVGGDWGTLSEIALARKADKPVVGLDSWEIDGIEGFAAPAEAVAELLRRLG